MLWPMALRTGALSTRNAEILFPVLCFMFNLEQLMLFRQVYSLVYLTVLLKRVNFTKSEKLPVPISIRKPNHSNESS